MTRKLAISFEPSSLRRSRMGAITGILFFDFGQRQFPGPGWSDFAAVVLLWWVQGLEVMDSGGTAEFQFMDGPYRVRATPREPGTLKVECIESRRAERAIFTAIVSTRELVDEVRRAAAEVLTACRQRGWESKDLAEIAKRLE